MISKIAITQPKIRFLDSTGLLRLLCHVIIKLLPTGPQHKITRVGVVKT